MAAYEGGHGRLARLLPSTIASRFSVSMIAAAALVYIAIGLLIGFSLATYTRSIARDDAGTKLAEMRASLQSRAEGLSNLTLGFSQWQDFYLETAAPDPVFISAEFDPWLRERAAATAVLWANASGHVINSSGSAADVEALLALSRKHPRGVTGTASLPGGPAIVTISPIVGDPAAVSVGMLAVARTITNSRLPVADDTYQLALVPLSAVSGEKGWREVSPPDGFSSASTRVGAGKYYMRASLEGLDGSPVLGVQLTRPDPWLGEGRVWIIVLLPLAMGIATLGVGYGLGAWLGNSVAKPLLGFITYVEDQGYLALQGLRTDQELLIDPGLPKDVAQLGHVIADLMTQLRVNQAELIEAGDQALAAERAFRTVVEESPEVKILVRDGVVEIANPAAAHFFGLQLGDLLRADPGGLFSGVRLLDEQGEQIHLLDIARLAGRASITALCMTPDQPDRWIEFSVAFIDPEERDYVISARNITEERRLEALREEVISLVSHDLRSPLTVVRGYLDILDKPLDEERRTKAVDSARRSAERMENLLNDLLHATKAEAVFAPKVMRPIDLSSLVESVATSMQLSAEQPIQTSLDREIIVLGDPVRLEQAVSNLVGNAIKHGPMDGDVRVGVHEMNGRAIISVEDDGPGIPEDLREAVFDRGARGNASDQTPGLGLGLYIVRVVAEAHGGVAFVDAVPDGTRFVLDLPILQRSADDL